MGCLLSRHFGSKLLLRFVFLGLSFFSSFGLAWSDCNQVSQSVGADDSTEIGYFLRLLEKGDRAGLEDFLHLWYPARKPLAVEPYFVACQSGAWLGFRSDSILKPECQPDTYYSYGPEEKLSTLQGAMPDGEDWEQKSPNGNRDLFTTLSPASTFYYGRIPVRIKIKPGVAFALIDYGGKLGFLTYRHASQYQDFTFRDASVIDSWSYGTPEHYDEIVRDVLKIASGEPAIRYVEGEPYGNGLNRILSHYTTAHVEPTKAGLRSNLRRMVEMILTKKGRIYYNRGVCRNRARHFQTLKPSYIHAHVVDDSEDSR